MLEINRLDILIDHKLFIENLNLTLTSGDKLAIIGEEGNGKSTLLKVLSGICDYAVVRGDFSFQGAKVGYLPQSFSIEKLEKTVFDYLFTDSSDYYQKVNDCYSILRQLHLTDSLFSHVFSSLSGGEKVKIAILKLLLEKAEILLLDEPTNDLDLAGLEWLENFIYTTSLPVMFVSHDETLLARCANRILHLELVQKKRLCRYTVMNIGYESYVRTRLEKLAKETRTAELEQREYRKKTEKLQQLIQKVDHQQATITRADPHGGRLLKKKMHSLKSQEKRLDQTKLTEIPDVAEDISFFFEPFSFPSRKKVLHLELETLFVGETILAKDIFLEVIGPQHIVIVGKNGSGKTTLLKEIVRILKERTDLKIGYMPQNYEDLFVSEMRPIDFLTDGNPLLEVKARQYLGRMNFTREEMEGMISLLSGGSKAKLLLLSFIFRGVNVLLLDEPTRNVSPLSNPVIRDALKSFSGAVISISHDRKYIEEVGEIIYQLDAFGLTRIR